MSAITFGTTITSFLTLGFETSPVYQSSKAIKEIWDNILDPRRMFVTELPSNSIQIFRQCGALLLSVDCVSTI